MKGKNFVELIGYVGGQPEFSNLQNQNNTLVARMSISTHDTYTGNKDNDTTWHRVTFFGKSAENLQKLNFEKGAEIHIEGHLTYHQYQDKKYNDVTHYSTEIVCDRFELLHLEKKDNRNNNSNANNYGGNNRNYNNGNRNNNNNNGGNYNNGYRQNNNGYGNNNGNNYR